MKRTVLCIQSVGLDEQRALPPAHCQHLPRPPAAAPCHPEVPCPSPWAAGSWSECSVTCGNGTQRRPVLCSNSTGAACDPAQRPSGARPCSLPPCHQSWDTDWSGSGSSSREVFNEIHYIPSNHIPEFTPLVPNVPEPNDVNVIAEEDFSARKGNVFVDDFYYDYNFINFHEDLSYYPFTEKEPEGEEPGAGGTEGPRELPTEALLPPALGGDSEERPGTQQENASAPADGRDTERGDAATGDLLSVLPEDVGSAAPGSTSPGLLGEEEEEEAALVPRSERRLPTQSSVSRGQQPWDEPRRAVPTRASLGQDGPAPWGPHAVPTASPGPEGRGTASSAGTGRQDSGDAAVAVGGAGTGAAPQPMGRHGRAGAAERVLGTPAGGRSPGLGRADLALPTPRVPGWEGAGSAGSPQPAVSPPPAGAEGAPAGRGGRRPELHAPGAPSSPPWLATAAPAVPLSPALPTPAPRVTPVLQDAPGPAVGTAPAHGTPAHTAGSPREWGTEGVTQHPDPASPRTQLSARGTPLSVTAPREPSPWTPPGTPPEAPWTPPETSPETSSEIPWIPPGTSLREPSPWTPPGTPPGTSLREPSPWTPPWTPPEAPWTPPGTPPGTPWTHPGTSLREPSPWKSPETPWLPPGTPLREPSPWTPPGTSVSSAGSHKLSQPTPLPPLLWEKGLEEEEEEEEEEALLPPSTSSAATAKPSWEVGNWSECSATCGVGAVWRPVRCSGGSGGCAVADRPVPAQRCSLRPCSSWRVGSWSKCSRSCGGGTKVRDVHCVDTRDQRLLRPFHCRAGLAQPPAQLPCRAAPCLAWYTSSWRECSEPCGGGEQARLVTCPEPGRCEETSRPNSTRPCNSQPCTTWVVGSWGQCSAPCGGGIQRRQVKCMDTRTGVAEEDSSLCDHEPWPDSTQKCNPQDCDSPEPGVPCERDRLTFAFCQTLRLLGRCQLPTVRVQCCRSCGQPGPQRGHQRLSRR